MHALLRGSGVKVRCRRGRRAARRGAATVELALVAPVFFLVVIGLIEVGRAITVQQLLTNASREGARVAGNESTTLTSTVEAAVDNYLSGSGVSGATTQVSPTPLSGLSTGQSVTVTVSIPYNQVSCTPSPWFLANKTLVATSAMSRQSSP